MIGAVVVGTAALLGIAGRWYRRGLARSIDARFERNPDGTIRGAEPIMRHGANGGAVLLVHGGGDTPQTLTHVTAALSERGYTVAAPLLPGHGRDLAAFGTIDADTLYNAVRRELETLRGSHEWVGVVGLSMGGALSARLAAETQQVDALVLLSPYLSMPAGGDLLARTSWAWGPFFPAVKTASDRSVFDPAARAVSLGYGAFTSRSLRALRVTALRGYAALPAITAPTLVMQSTTDNRISSAATARAFGRIGAAEKKLEWIEGAGHVITVDFGWEKVVERTVSWLETVRSRPPARRPAPRDSR